MKSKVAQSREDLNLNLRHDLIIVFSHEKLNESQLNSL